MNNPSIVAAQANWPDYRAVWRWHFYAGLFCIPFVLWLSVTGSIYLFKPQVEAWLDRPYEQLQFTGARASPRVQTEAALAAVPGSVLHAYELPLTPQSAVRVIVAQGPNEFRVYVHPQTLQILKVVREDERLMRIIFRLHGELMLGDGGSMVVELAASWAIVMIVTGLYLWWPRNVQGLAGVVYPRLGADGRLFWRDLHAVIGLWVSAFALFMLVSGLPWSKFWGGNLKALRQLGETVLVQQDWTTGRVNEHAEHQGHAAMRGVVVVSDYAALDRLVPLADALHLPAPVLISPPSNKFSAKWTAKSDTQNRPLRVNLVLDGVEGRVLSRKEFRDRKLLDRIIGTGVAAHEGQLFGWPNQLMGVLTALGLITLCVSALTMWWKRRIMGVLGAPAALQAARFSWGLAILAIVFGVLLPLMGISMLAVLMLERYVLRKIPRASAFLGLQSI